MTLVRRLAIVGVGAALVTAFSAPVAFAAADASVHAAAQCGGEEEEENGTPVSVVHVTYRHFAPREIGVSAGCFTPGETVDVTYCHTLLGTTEADSQGVASTTVVLPQTGCMRECTSNRITMTGEATGHLAVGYLVFACATGAPSGGPRHPQSGGKPMPTGPIVEATGANQPPATLPFTGAPAAPLSLTGAALVAFGAMLTVATRRRYAARHARPA